MVLPFNLKTLLYIDPLYYTDFTRTSSRFRKDSFFVNSTLDFFIGPFLLPVLLRSLRELYPSSEHVTSWDRVLSFQQRC